METINDYSKRFLEIIDAMEVSDYSIWKNTEGISKGQLSQVRTGRGGASLSMIEALCRKYPNINVDYIITGRGAKFIDNVNGNKLEDTSQLDYWRSMAKSTMEMYELKAKKVTELELENIELKVKLTQKQESA